MKIVVTHKGEGINNLISI